jgi:hypothetical protein
VKYSSPRPVQQLRSGSSGKSEFCASLSSGRILSTTYVYVRQSSLNPKANTMGSHRPQHDLPATCVIYRPAVFFCNLILTALSFPQGKIKRAFQKMLFTFLFLGAFARLRKVTPSSHVSVRPRGRTRLPLAGFSLNLISEYFSNFYQEKFKLH